MPTYRANARFGPWRAGDVFESQDEYHAGLAADGHLLTRVDAAEAEAKPPAGASAAPPERAGGPTPAPQGAPPTEAPAPAGGASEGEPTQGADEG